LRKSINTRTVLYQYRIILNLHLKYTKNCIKYDNITIYELTDDLYTTTKQLMHFVMVHESNFKMGGHI